MFYRRLSRPIQRPGTANGVQSKLRRKPAMLLDRLRHAPLGLLRRIPRPVWVVLYLLALASWVVLAYDTVGLWQTRQQDAHQLLTQVLNRPTPPVVVASSATATSTPLPTAFLPTASPSPTFAPIPTPTQIPAAKLHPKTGRYIAAWLPTSFDADQARASFEANKDILDEVSPFWYEVDSATGALKPEQGARDVKLVEAAHAADVLVIPSIHNVNQLESILPIIADPKLRTAHIAALVDEVMQFNYDGIDVDYETLAPETRANYSAFMQELSTALHAKDKLLTVAVHAKTSDDGGYGGFQDWKLLGEICDRVRIMTYDYSWRGGGPGPIAPLSWVAQVGEYARAVVPAGKIQLGVPFYAYNWGAGEQHADPQTWLQVQSIIQMHTPAVNFRETDATGPVQESSFQYKLGSQLRTVWFADSRALQAKLDLVEQQELGGLAIWRLGSEDPQNWKVIRKQLTENPSIIQQIVDTYLPDH